MNGKRARELRKQLVDEESLPVLVIDSHAPPKPQFRVDEETYATLKAPEARLTKRGEAKLLIGGIERELARGVRHRHPKTGSQLTDVEEILACLNEHGSVDVHASWTEGPQTDATTS